MRSGGLFDNGQYLYQTKGNKLEIFQLKNPAHHMVSRIQNPEFRI